MVELDESGLRSSEEMSQGWLRWRAVGVQRLL
jgi:hypothetical protein